MTHASVFSGIGGPEVAAVMLGWENLFHCEINPFGRTVLDYWFPNSKSYEDITTTDFSEWRGRVNVLTGGFPCQPFSYAGQRRGAQDDRYLWPYMFRCIDQIQPDWIIAENVAGILTMVEQGEVSDVASSADLFDSLNDIRGYRLRETFTLQRICDDLESHGYTVQPVLIPACAVGAPHRRDRVFIIGHRNGCKWTLTNPASDGRHGNTQQNGRKRCANRDSIGTTAQGSDWFGLWSKPWVHGFEQSTTHAESQQERGHGTDGRISRKGQEQFGRESIGDYQLGARWQGFPTVSPVHRGNDGLPFDVDDLTLPFGKWRTEALKAYGNAIVPQVMYEIFRAIDQIEHNI